MAARSGNLADSLPHNGPGEMDLIVETVFLALDYVFTGIRLWSRQLQKTRLEANDILIVIALLILTARYAVILALILECGLGLHSDEVERISGPGTIVVFRKLTYAIGLMWLILVILIKVSILHFYTVLFGTKRIQYFVYGVMIFTIAFGIAAFFSFAFFCRPPQKTWFLNIPGRCGDSDTMYIVLASTDLAIDIVVILLPMPVLWRLQLATVKKVSLTFIFGLGFIIIIITSIRIKYFADLNPDDITYTSSEFSLQSSLVPLLGIINANLPLSGPAIHRVLTTSILSSFGKRANHTGTTDNSQRVREEGYRFTNIVVSRRTDSHPDTGQINVRRDWEVRSSPAIEGYPNAIYSDSFFRG